MDAALLGVLCLVLLLPLLITGRTVLPVDHWGVRPISSHAVLPHAYTTDPDGSVGNDLAWTAYTAESLRRGIVPLWDPYQGLGDTFIAQGGSQVFYPPNWLHALIPVGYWDVLSFVHFFLGSWFVYLFALECGLERWPALLAGACVYTQGFMQGYLAMSMDLAASTWLPLVLFGVERYFGRGRTPAAFAAIAAGTFLLGTGSHQGIATICVLTVVAWILARSLMARSVRPALAMTIPFAIGHLCAAPVLVPFLQNAFAVRSEMVLQQANLGLRTLPSVVYPFVYGAFYSPVFGNPGVSAGDVCAPLPAAVWFLGMGGVVAGIFRRNGRMLTLGGMALWGVLWMMDVPPFNLLRYAPMMRRLGPPYLMCAIQLCLCVLAGYGASALASWKRRERRVAGAVWAVFAGGLWLIVAVVLRGAWPNVDLMCVAAGAGTNLVWSIVGPAMLLGSVWFGRRVGREEMVFAVALAVVLGSAIAFFPNGADYRAVLITRLAVLAAVMICGAVAVMVGGARRATWITVALVLCVNSGLAARYPGLPKRTNPFAETPYVSYLMSHAQAGRGYGLECAMFPDLSSRYFLPTMNTLFALLQPASKDFVSRYADECQPPQLFYGVRREHCPDRPPMAEVLHRRAVWDYLGVRYLFSGDADELRDAARAVQKGPADAGMKVAFSSTRDPVHVWENEQAGPLAYVAPQTAAAENEADAQAKLVSEADLHRVAYVEGGTPACASDPSFPAGEADSELKAITIGPNRIDARVRTHTAGTFVYVGSYAKGWTARVDDRDAPAFRVNGAFLGTCIRTSGEHRIALEYRPPYWGWPLAAAGAGLLWFGWGLYSALFARAERPS